MAIALHSSGMPDSLQRRLPGRHCPLHMPSALHRNSQAACGSHVPISLHSSGVAFDPQRRAPGEHEPPHEPLEHRLRQGLPETHVPVESQTSGVSSPLPPQRRAPGAHSPVHSPSPLHANGHGAAGAHEPIALQVSGI